LLLIVFIRCTTNTEVDVIVYNAKVYTVDSTFSTKEAFAVKNGMFIDVGTSDDILKRYRAKEIIDAEGKAVFPGFYDSHAHSFLYADMLQQVDLNGSKSITEMIERIQDYQRRNPDKKWIVGAGWDQNLWTNGDFPTKDSLDIYFPDIPVYLYRIDYHTAVVNSKALEIAQLDSAYILEGGLILTDSLGDPNGVLVDNATAIVSRFIPEPVGNELLRQLRQIQDSLFSVGLTSIVDAGLDRNQLDILQKFYVDDSLKIRNYAMIMAEPHGIDKYIRDGVFQSERLTIRAVKLLADGALGSRGACLLQPYSDTTMSGFLLHPIDEFEESLRRLSKTGFQVATHAIGDSTNRVILDLYGKYLGEENNKRWRIEHAQIVDSADFVKFAKYKIIPSVQPTHATSDMYWAEKRLGQQRVKNAYAYRRLLDQYGKVAIGSDFPVEHINPLYGFHAAVARVDKTGYPNGGFQPDDALTREEALRGMTIWAAYACFQEKSRGSIQKGKDADFVILDKDIMTIPLGEIRDTKIRRTVVAGETVYLQ
jgi:predicted amidohydrolase YtcJ